MKRLILATALLLATVGITQAASKVVTSVNETGLAFTNNYTQDLNALGVGQVSAQAVYSSATVPSQTFTDGSQSTGNITVASLSNLLSTPATNQITVTATANLTAAPATDNLTIVSTNIAGSHVTIGNGNLTYVFKEGLDWFRTDTASGTALALNTILKSVGFITSTVPTNGTVIYATSTFSGTAANNYVLSVDTANMTVASANFTGGRNLGLANSYFTFNGRSFYEGSDWHQDISSSGTAKNIAALLQKFSLVTATSPTGSSVVYATATTNGSAGNAFTLTGSTAALAVAGATFSGGLDAATVSIGGVALTFGVDIATKSTTALQATEIARAINASTVIGAAVTSTAPTGSAIVYATSTAIGAVNYSLKATPTASLTVSGAAMTGGTASAYTLNGQTITIPNHGFTLALPVLYTTATARGITPLVWGTTYYIVPVDANTIKIATTSAFAQAQSLFLTFTSSVTSTAATYTLAPLTITGTPGFKWQVSNDNTNWSDLTATANNVTISSITFSSPYTAASTYWDLGTLNARYLNLKVTGPTAGGVQLKVIMNGKNASN